MPAFLRQGLAKPVILDGAPACVETVCRNTKSLKFPAQNIKHLSASMAFIVEPIFAKPVPPALRVCVALIIRSKAAGRHHVGPGRVKGNF